MDAKDSKKSKRQQIRVWRGDGQRGKNIPEHSRQHVQRDLEAPNDQGPVDRGKQHNEKPLKS